MLLANRSSVSHLLHGSLRGFLRICFLVLIPHKHLLEGPVRLRTAQRQHLIAIRLVPPGTRTLEPDMADEFMRRFHAATPQWIAPAAQPAIVRPAPMLIEREPAIEIGRASCRER